MYNQQYNHYNIYEHNSFGYVNEDMNNMINNDVINSSSAKLTKKRHKKSEMNNLDCLETSINTKKFKQNQSLNKICKFTIDQEDSNDTSGNEKTRLISINEAFDILRVNIPTFPYERRLSKIDTLHLAISYINLLELVIESNMTMYDYIRTYVYSSFNGNKNKPIWATSGNFEFKNMIYIVQL